MTPTNPIDLAAATWVLRHREGALSATEAEQFDKWVALDSRHLGAFVRLSAAELDLQRLSALSAGKGAESQWRSRVGPSRRVGSMRWATAASILILIVAGASTWLYSQRNDERYVSGIGELRHISLVDGSHMTLNTATETHVDFTDSRREVNLSRGEALFDVAKDPVRPFIVRAGHLTIEALGTAFAVRHLDDRVDVTVTSGTVEVTDTAARNSRPKRLGVNDRVTATGVGFVKAEPLARDVVDRALAWRQGMVAFNGESLAEAAAVLNRHNRKRLTIDDPKIAAQPIIGMFRADDIESFAKTAATVTGAQVVEDGEALRLEARALN